jgi:alkanesulfonate monooxygenase SsuD/methylene tetrahydromethanopterin reductase-like flavin-dependent oxidoreductase (luciferase family)
MDWHTRGARQAEQVEVLRRLWTEGLVTFKGKFHDMVEVNIVPQPAQRPIPIWFGGSSDAVVKRAARLGDGWMPIISPDEKAAEKLEDLRGHLRSFGRDASTFGLEGWLRMCDDDPQHWAADADGWRRLGTQTVMLYPMYMIPTFEGQVETLRRFKEVVER